LAGVKIGVGFERNTGWSTDSSGQQGITDADGELLFSGQSNGHITYGGRKVGYYDSYYDYDFKDLGVFGWEPWNPELKVLMRRIENPTPMYARDTKMANIKIKIPVIGKEVGFDLIAYDWVAPYGNGQHIDFIFYLEKTYRGFQDYDAKLTIKFLHPMDGIVEIEENLTNGSQFKLPRIAPKNGYKNSLQIIRNKKNNTETYRNYKFNDNYIFRVRAEVNNGNLARAMYGKIRGPIEIDPRVDPTEVYFKYYLNPDYTKNLEFDPKRNLFGNLPGMEQVNEP